ncbi:NADH-quinone oxidoreductase subunit NuoE family protein [Flexilinea flocculi]|uniref:NADH:ubiquinone oxidoreductase 24 kD subunit n=1 Tax=Flexilinea flocculi TaxID=1678840 RepID=A0A0S7BP17_9CHLR|nr:NAD(P)H-dependent oxidoreductase subunit E [Flexilinea flocculi]GAP40107.1 NADH:ubiquinone oxidoreductase 24 kD subunit [Flexilinea flocculi]
MKGSKKIIDEIVERYASDPGGLIPALLKIHETFGSIPEEAYPVLSQKFSATRLQILKILNFYDDFTSDPRKKNVIRICDGFTCNDKGSHYLMEKMKLMFETRKKMSVGQEIYSVESIPCQGLCGFGPIMIVNNQVYIAVTAEKADKILSEFFIEPTLPKNSNIKYGKNYL